MLCGEEISVFFPVLGYTNVNGKREQTIKFSTCMLRTPCSQELGVSWDCNRTGFFKITKQWLIIVLINVHSKLITDFSGSRDRLLVEHL